MVVRDSTVRYRIVSYEKGEHAEIEEREGVTAKGNLKIAAINLFWGPRRYLILVER